MSSDSISAFPTVYRELQERIDRLSVPYPRTASGVELRLLQALFTEEEAAVALELSAAPESTEVIARRLPSMLPRQLGKMLVRLSRKRAINSGSPGSEASASRWRQIVRSRHRPRGADINPGPGRT